MVKLFGQNSKKLDLTRLVLPSDVRSVMPVNPRSK